MNEVIKQLRERKSIRIFEERQIPKDVQEAIFEAAAMAPSAGNQQLYTILNITDPDKKARLAETCDHQPFIADAKLVLIFLADVQKWYDAFLMSGCEPRKPGVGDLLLAVDDALIAAQNAVVAAHSFGLGSCYIGDVMENCEIHRELLNLPEYVFPAAMVVFGYPTESQLQREKPQRVEMKHIVHENAYRCMDAEEFKEMFEPKAKNKTYEQWMKAFCDRKYNSDFSREMTRSVGVFLEAFER